MTKKKILLIWAPLLILVLMAGLMGCDLFGGDTGGDDDEDDVSISYESFASPSIKVENLTGSKLIAFKNSLSPNTLISGIPAYATNHGLNKDPALFGETGTFIMLLITEEQYAEHKDNLGALNNEVFARIFAFYNHSATNANIFQISSKVGGNGRLVVSNPTNFNVELRSGGPTGEILGYAAARMTSGTVLYLDAPASYDIYPVFKFFNPVDQELYSVTPKYKDGALVGKDFMKPIGLADGALTASFNINDVNDAGDFNLSSGSVYFRITNNSAIGLDFYIGDTRQITSLGIDRILSSHSENFALRLSKNPDGTFPASRSFAQLKIGTNQLWLTVPAQEYELDYMYEIEVTGSNPSTIQLGSVTKKEKVDLDKMFGLTN